MFYYLEAPPLLPKINASDATISDSDNFGNFMDACATREKVINLIASLRNGSTTEVSAEDLKSSLDSLSCSIDLVIALLV
jgi:hypothetical protein